MAILGKGHSFGTTEQVTSTKLSNLVDAAKFVNTSGVSVANSGNGTCVPDGGLEVSSSTGQLQIASDGVTTAKILNSNVTKAKIENVANMKALGNTSGSATAPQEVSILDEDNMSSNSATSLATQQSIKAYVDNNSGSGGYNLYRTVDARGGAGSAQIKNWSSNLNGTTSLGAFGTGSSGTDQPNIFTFSSTGTYFIELNVGIYDNDSDLNDHFGVQLMKTTDGTAQTSLTATTNTGGTGGQKKMIYEPGYDQTHSLGKDIFVSMSFIYIVGNTSTDNLVIQVKARSAANLAQWEGSGILKITQIS